MHHLPFTVVVLGDRPWVHENLRRGLSLTDLFWILHEAWTLERSRSWPTFWRERLEG